MPTPILIVGTGRSGTSCVAGILHKLGVHMGDHFIETPKENPYGTYECQDFMRINALRREKTTTPSQWFQNLHRLFALRRQQHPRFGFKDPYSLYYAQEEPLRSCQLLICRRDPQKTVQSYLKCYQNKGWSKRQCREEVRKRLKLLDKLPENTPEVHFEDLLENPEREVAWITETLDLNPSKKQIQQAVEHIHGNQ